MATLAQEALVEMRTLLFELRPDSLAEEGLGPALARLVETFRGRTGMALSYSGTAAGRLAPNAEMAAFRIVQEALGNAAKHAQANEAAVTLAVRDGVVRITMRDNGVGFDPAARVAASADGRSGGQGLRSMRERAAGAGLVLRVESAPGSGTTIAIEAPLTRLPGTQAT